MKGEKVSLKHLQRALTMELTTVNTYLLQAEVLDDWGIDRLAARMRDEIEEERDHAQRFLERLLFLEGTPDVQKLDKIGQDKSVREIFDRQLKMELEARAYYAKAADECREVGDLGSFELFMDILKDEEEHIDFVETQFDLMGLMGEQMYIARHVSALDADEED